MPCPDKRERRSVPAAPANAQKVLHGDRALASVTGLDRRGRREGMIVEVLERRLTRLIGRFTIDAGLSYVVPDDGRIQRNVQIPVDARLDARNGQLVVCEIVIMPDAHRPPIGRVLTVLGDKLTPSLVVEAAIHGHDLPHEFPARVLAEALAVPLTTTEADIAGRVDLRARCRVTIDGETLGFRRCTVCECPQRLSGRSSPSPMIALTVTAHVRTARTSRDLDDFRGFVDADAAGERC